MGLELTNPWALVLLPIGIGWVWWVDVRYRRVARSLKARVTLWVRLVLVVCLALAIAGPSLLQPVQGNDAWILLDVSDSTMAAQPMAEASISQALREVPSGQRAGVIAFGANAMVETPLSESPSFTGVHTAVGPENSSLGEALGLAAALIPEENAGRVVVVSDGQTDDVRSVANRLAARGIVVDALQLEGEAVPDAQVTEMKTPTEVYEGQSFPIQVTVDSSLDTEGTLVLYQNNAPTTTRQVTLRKGENTFVFQDVADVTGVATYQVRLSAVEDQQGKNNTASTYVYVAGAPRVLLVEGALGQGAEMQKMLAAAGMQVETLLPAEMPAQADHLRQYDGIVLANVDYEAATQEQWEAVDTAVRILGRGLCVLGGDSSYALGGYRGSLLEAMLPVTVDVRNKLQMPALSLMLVIDKSGSMTEGQFGTTRLEVAKEAAMRSTEVLTDRDQIGVIAFDDAAKWVVPMQQVTDVAAIQSMIGTIRPGGGTAFYSALKESVDALVAAQTPQKHIIFLSDGEPADQGFEQLMLAASENGITVTTVAVGSGANTMLMELLSTLGGGRAYVAGEFDNIPKIFTKETFLAGGSYVQNRRFTPVVTENAPLTDFDGFPQLAGYLATTEKALATVSMVSDQDDPILAWWQYGAGTVLAWTSDTKGAWSQDFLMWENAPGFFGGLVNQVLAKDARDGTLEMTEEEGAMGIRYRLPEGIEAEKDMETTAIVLGPEGQEEYSLTEMEPGVYEGSFASAGEGAYALRVEQRAGDTLLRSKEGGAVVGFAEEYDLRRQNRGSTLAALVEATGGRMLTWEEPLLSAESQRVRVRRPLSPLLALLTLCLLLADIALRRLAWEGPVQSWLQRKTPEKQRSAEDGKQAQEPRPAKNKPRSAPPNGQPPTRTTDALLQAKRKRKQM